MTDSPGAAGPGFELDPFQEEALAAVDAGHSVVVAAPTGAGKTVVAEHAVARALHQGDKAFYTTPIKALSNQKYHDLTRAHGGARVGLLTGDNSINPDAPVVVMTTEVLRNMLYARSAALEGLSHVVLDEVHYLQDPYRGPVWEEVVIHLPPSVALVCLSATVSNADELADWITAVRGPTDLVVEHRRPVELEHLYVVGERGRSHLHVLPILERGRPNPRGQDYDVGGRGAPRRGRRNRRRWVTPRRTEVIGLLRDRRMLPAIYFLFSRAGCDDAAAGAVSSGLILTRPDERQRIDEIVEDRLVGLSDDDRMVLGFDGFLRNLHAGIAAHHAGMVPPFKEAVEGCFVEGLIKVVFATETLALGINMPARSVVIERLTKFTGEQHEFLTPGQYTQLTGRAGRRGIDEEGDALVLWSPWVRFRQLASLARSREFHLRSAFRPTYNMAANLVRRHSEEEAHALLSSSFGQFQTNREVLRHERLAADRREEADELRTEIEWFLPPGTRFGDLLGDEPPTRRRERRGEVEAAVRDLIPGDVVDLSEVGTVAVLSIAQRGPYSRLKYVDVDGEPGALHSTALAEPPTRLASLTLPVPFTPNAPEFRRDVAASLRHRIDQVAPPPHRSPRHETRTAPSLRALQRRAKKVERLRDDADDAQRRVDEASGSLTRQFDRVLGVLEDLDYVEGWTLTLRGARLARVYHECDLLVTESLERGLLDDVDAAGLAGLVSCFTYEHRSSDEAPAPWFPTAELGERFRSIQSTADEINSLEARLDVPPTRPPDATFLPLAHAWASGEDLDDLLEDEDLSGGDFVRNVKQLIDLLRQLGQVAADERTQAAARAAADRLLRGVVAASTLVEED